MNRLDENPFGEPMLDNPFADPAVQQAARSAANAQNTLEDYNPFEGGDKKPQTETSVNVGLSAAPPSVQSAPNNFEPTITNSGHHISTAELQRRQEELERKAAELDRREQQLQANSTRLNNWPPLPQACCFQPCFYQDINVDIPSEFQRIVRNLYYVWMLYTLTMCANVIGGVILMIHKSEFAAFGLAVLYAFLFTPASYLCWFRPAYKAFRSDSSFNFMVFFFVFFFQMLLTIFQTIGIPGSGYCGFITAIMQFDSTASGIFVGLLILIIALSFGACAAGDLMMLTKIHSIYRSTGASFAKAQAEFTTGFMQNRHVRETAASAFSSAMNPSNNRY
ncbi:unnamed protein product [Hermetia illucens]|uniref:Secretory carrier-associated membrane protein n=1 Tax=Hermetia illucens TaxID=343691 RepID=A0A7R8UV18_HERIL|nr:secretory carrier-associated membrane protein 3 [Hermetia illucens]CAD7087640.1 unnamed protein product [Hermetia illucens]